MAQLPQPTVHWAFWQVQIQLAPVQVCPPELVVRGKKPVQSVPLLAGSHEPAPLFELLPQPMTHWELGHVQIQLAPVQVCPPELVVRGKKPVQSVPLFAGSHDPAPLPPLPEPPHVDTHWLLSHDHDGDPEPQVTGLMRLLQSLGSEQLPSPEVGAGAGTQHVSPRSKPELQAWLGSGVPVHRPVATFMQVLPFASHGLMPLDIISCAFIENDRTGSVTSAALDTHSHVCGFHLPLAQWSAHAAQPLPENVQVQVLACQVPLKQSSGKPHLFVSDSGLEVHAFGRRDHGVVRTPWLKDRERDGRRLSRLAVRQKKLGRRRVQCIGARARARSCRAGRRLQRVVRRIGEEDLADLPLGGCRVVATQLHGSGRRTVARAASRDGEANAHDPTAPHHALDIHGGILDLSRMDFAAREGRASPDHEPATRE